MISEMRLENMEEKSWCFPGDICDFMEAQNSKEPRRRATAPTGREMRRSALARTACLITQSVRCGAEEMRGVVRCVFIFLVRSLISWESPPKRRPQGRSA